MFALIRKLYKIRLLSFIGIFRLLLTIKKEGINLMTLLGWAARNAGQRKCIIDELESLTYKELYEQSQQLSAKLHIRFPKPRLKVALIGRNSAELLRLLFALSRCEANIYLLNIEIKTEQLQHLRARFKFDLLFVDDEFFETLAGLNFGGSTLKMSEVASWEPVPTIRLQRAYGGQLVVLTGGSTGDPKPAARKPSLFSFLQPFFALLRQVQLDRYHSVYIGTPIYHGFGVATVFAAMALGATLYLRRRFDAADACELVAAQKIEVLTLVPLMLKRILQYSPQHLNSVQAYLTGGAPLQPDVVLLVQEQMGARLFNLYGTSEVGFCIMATPQDLCYSALTIGQPVEGVKLHILDAQNRELGIEKVGRLSVRAGWSVKKSAYIETGDLGYRDAKGYIFLCGRTDDMIVSGGENVYPIELENILLQHPHIEQVAVMGIEDADFGQRLRAFVQLKPKVDLQKNALLAWLKGRCTRYQIPRDVVFVEELPYTVLGKINKNTLKG